MKHVDGRFKGVRNHNIYYQAWLPDGNVKAVLFLVHGLGEYCGRFANLVNHYVPLGYAVYGLDHLGHGKSDGEREVIERFDDFTDPMRLYYQMVKGWQPGKPVFIFGHSMGGLITCCYLLDRQEDFQGAIISAPAIKVSDNISSVTVIMGKILSRIAPKVGVVSLDPNCISRDSEVVRTYVKDPLVFHGKTPARLAGEMLKVMMRVRAELDKITLPFIVVQGGEDKLVDPKGAQMLYDRAGSKDKTLKIYKGLYHEIHNEPERSTMFKDVEAWLSVRV
jgi:alpha-beta hydrolase superfamily lysophospholipase